MEDANVSAGSTEALLSDSELLLDRSSLIDRRESFVPLESYLI